MVHVSNATRVPFQVLATAREGKQVSISKETHDKVAMIVRWLGDGEVTMADFTENVVSEFLRTHRDELNRMLNAVPRVEL